MVRILLNDSNSFICRTNYPPTLVGELAGHYSNCHDLAVAHHWLIDRLSFNSVVIPSAIIFISSLLIFLFFDKSLIFIRANTLSFTSRFMFD